MEKDVHLCSHCGVTIQATQVIAQNAATRQGKFPEESTTSKKPKGWKTHG